MAEIINLRQVRKAKQRDAAVRQAEANRSRHGETKGEKLRRQQEADRLTRTVDGAKREGGDGAKREDGDRGERD